MTGCSWACRGLERSGIASDQDPTHQGERQKAARGELRPAASPADPHPRMSASPSIRTRKCRSGCAWSSQNSGSCESKAVMRHLRRGKPVLLPVRPLHGPAPHDVVWRPADSARVINILKNPACWLPCLWLLRRPDPLRRQPGSDRLGRQPSRRRIGRSVSRMPTRLTSTGTSSWRTEGSLRTMSVATMRAGLVRPVKAMHCCRGLSAAVGAPVGCACDTGPHGDYPVYVRVADSSAEGRPRCQEVRALAVDAEVERLILTALTPDRIVLAIAALGEIEEDDDGAAVVAQTRASSLRRRTRASPI